MASIKVKFRPSTVPSQPGAVYYQIIHNRQVRQITTRYHIFPNEWDATASSLHIDSDTGRRALLLEFRHYIRCDCDRLARIVRKLQATELNYSCDRIIDEYHRHSYYYSLQGYMLTLIESLKAGGRHRTAETYIAALNSFRNFLSDRNNSHDLMLDTLTADMMDAYSTWLRKRGICLNTISFYNRILRAVYNRAVDDDIISDARPFRRVYTGIVKTAKRALPIGIIKKIKNLDLTASPALDYARDIFILSFMFRGMSFVDMAFLRKTDLVDGHITYCRRKTGQQLTIKMTSQMRAILSKYPENSSDYLLPIIRTAACSERSVYRNTSSQINRSLKTIATMVGLTVPLSLYVARHSWASAAKTKGIPISVISEGMGHDSESTTRIYLAALDTSLIDRANSLIISSI